MGGGVLFGEGEKHPAAGASGRLAANWITGEVLRWMKERKVRDRLVLSTKVFYALAEGPNDRSLSRRHIMQAVDGSLRRLQTDYLDLYVIMEPDP